MMHYPFVKKFFRLKSASTAVGYQRGLCLQRSPAHTALWLHAVPEKGVAPHLGGVVVERAGRRLPDDIFEAQSFKVCAFDQLVHVYHISQMVLGIMIFKSFL